MNEVEMKDRLLELLTYKAVFGLDEEERLELDSLQRTFPNLVEESKFDETAAAIALSAVSDVEEMPLALKSKVIKDASKFFAAEESDEQLTFDKTSRLSQNITPAVEKTHWSMPQWLGWALAGAACIALVANFWLTQIGPNEIASVTPTPTVTPVTEPSNAEKLQKFLASSKDLVRTAWTDPKDESQKLGEVVWSDEKQQGYMVFKGLPANDAQKEAYQLWIFDETQDEKTPVDGGVFNIREDGEAIIPIDAKLKVKHPKMFAVTVEKPGGVVVSKREKIVALGKVQA